MRVTHDTFTYVRLGLSINLILSYDFWPTVGVDRPHVKHDLNDTSVAF